MCLWMLIPPELEFQVLVIGFIWVLGIELVSFARAMGALNHSAISSAISRP